MSCFLSTLTGRPLARERGEGVWGNREVPPQSRRRGHVGETWFPPRKRAEGERRSRRLRLLALALGVLDHLLRDVRGHFLVAEEGERVVPAPARQGRERLRVREDLGHRYLGADRRHAAGGIHAVQAPPARGE